MLLPVGAAFGALAARTVEFAFAAIFSVVPPRPVKLRMVATIELRTIALRTIGKWPVATGAVTTRPVALHAILAGARKPRAVIAAAIVAWTVKTGLVEARPCAALVAVATFALLPRLGFATRRTVAEILARAVADFAVGETAFAALAARRAITTIEFRTVAALELRAIST